MPIADTILRFTYFFTDNILSALQFIIFIRVLLSWFRPSENEFTLFLKRISNPILNTARKITPRTGMIDFSPLVALFSLSLLQLALNRFFVVILNLK